MDFLKNLSKFKLISLVASAIIVLISLIFLVFSISKPTMVPLYSNLGLEDMNLVSNKLQSMNIPFTTNTGGNQVLVPLDRVLGLRMSLAQEGIPSSANIVGYEVFDKSDLLGTSQFVNNINLVRALEGELARTIASLAPIETARVHLVIPKKELFSKIGSTPSASVVLKIRSGKKLNKVEVNGIANLVATAVPELKVDNVTILDQQGKPLKIANEDNDDSMINANVSEYQANIEKKLKEAVESILEKSVGVGKVKASVTATIDFDREVISSEVYDPDGQVLRSHKTSDENENEGLSKDNVSVANNIPNLPQQNQQPISSKSKSKSDEIANYEISKTVTNRVTEGGKIIKLSVAVLVDGIYTPTDNKESKLVYQERSPEEIAKLKALVEAAIGIDPSRGDKVEVINLQFVSDVNFDEQSNQNTFDWLKYDLKTVMQFIIIAIILILASFLLLKPLFNKVVDNTRENFIPELGDKIMQENNEAQNISLNTASKSLDEGEKSNSNDLKVHEKRYSDLLKYLNEAITQNKDTTLTVVRNWLYKGE